MDEYIDRQALLEDIENTLVFSGRPCRENPKQIGARMVVQRIRSAPAADVAPVVRGLWIPCDPDSDVRFYCSECGTEISTSWDYDCDEMWNGCPHCLARMDGE